MTKYIKATYFSTASKVDGSIDAKTTEMHSRYFLKTDSIGDMFGYADVLSGEDPSFNWVFQKGENAEKPLMVRLTLGSTISKGSEHCVLNDCKLIEEYFPVNTSRSVLLSYRDSLSEADESNDWVILAVVYEDEPTEAKY